MIQPSQQVNHGYDEGEFGTFSGRLGASEAFLEKWNVRSRLEWLSCHEPRQTKVAHPKLRAPSRSCEANELALKPDMRLMLHDMPFARR